MKPLKFFLLGQFEVQQNELGLSHKLWQSRQLRGILKILVAARGKPVSSSQILEIIWPNEDQKTARQHLYVRISQLRKLLEYDEEVELIQNITGGYRFGSNNNHKSPNNPLHYWIDVDEFEYLADQGRLHLEQNQLRQAMEMLENARDLYRADYLVEDIYEDWTMGERERLRDRYLILITELAETYALLGFYRRAINACRQVLAIEPCREAVYVRLMLYYYYAGEKGKALQIYDQCLQVMRTELGVDPDLSTTRLEEQIRSGDLWSQTEYPLYPPPNYDGRLFEVPYSLGKTPFSGRDREFAWLIQQWQATDRPVIWIEGEAGIGKTRLVEEFIRSNLHKGTMVLKLQPGNHKNSPYEAWIKIFNKDPEFFTMEGISEHSQSVLMPVFQKNFTSTGIESLQPASPMPVSKILDAIVELLQIKLPESSLLWVEDAHLLDQNSINLLSECLGKINNRVLIVCRTEDTPQNHPIRNLSVNSPARIAVFHLNRLLVGEVEKFLEQLNPWNDRHFSETIFSITQGNPLFMIATIQHLFEQGILFVDRQGLWQQAGLIEQALSPTIEETIALRLQQSSPPARRILDVVAVAGGELDYDHLMDVLEIGETLLIEIVDRLIESGFLVEPRKIESAELVLSHACYCEVLYQTLPKARRRIYHRRLAEALLASGKDTPNFAALLADHFFQGEDLERAFQFRKIAGDYALRLYAPLQALQQFQAAATYLESLEIEEDSEWPALIWMGTAESFRLSGQYSEAITYYQKALPNLKGALKPAAAYQMFQLKVFQGESLSAYEEITSGFEKELVNEGDSWALALYYWALSFVNLMRGKRKETRWINAQGWRVARRLIASGDMAPYWVQQRAFSTMLRAQVQWCNFQSAIDMGNRILSILDISDNDEDSNNLAATLHTIGNAYLNLGQYKNAQEKFQACHQLALKAGDPRLQSEGLIGMGCVCFELGDFAAATKFAEQAIEIAIQKNDFIREVNARTLLVQIAISQGTADENLPMLNNFLILARFQQADPYIANLLQLISDIHISLNQFNDAINVSMEAAEIAQRCGLKKIQCNAQLCLSLSEFKLHQYNLAAEHANQSVILAQEIESPFELGKALRNRALVCGKTPTQLQDAELAFEQFLSIGASYEAQRTQSQLQNWSQGCEENEI